MFDPDDVTSGTLFLLANETGFFRRSLHPCFAGGDEKIPNLNTAFGPHRYGRRRAVFGVIGMSYYNKYACELFIVKFR
jgi:hypothetical protein